MGQPELSEQECKRLQKRNISESTANQILPSLRSHRFRAALAEPLLQCCVVLHGHGMSAVEMEEWWDGLQLWHALKHTSFCFLQAPTKWHALSSQFLPSWFTYTEEYGGAEEDRICLQSLEASIDAFELVLPKALERCAPGMEISQVSCIGLSEGGCMALELARRFPFKSVVTLASYRRSEFASERLLCSWLALVASEDAVYRRPWTGASLLQARVRRVVQDEHYLHNSSKEVASFLRESLS